MIRHLITRALAVIMLAFLIAIPMTANAAYDIRTPIDCGKAPDSTVCQTNVTEDPLTGPNGVIRKVTVIISIIAGIAAVVVMVLAGISYITSNGDAETVNKAKKSIIFGAIGLVVIALAQPIINFVLSKV